MLRDIDVDDAEAVFDRFVDVWHEAVGLGRGVGVSLFFVICGRKGVGESIYDKGVVRIDCVVIRIWLG